MGNNRFENFYELLQNFRVFSKNFLICTEKERVLERNGEEKVYKLEAITFERFFLGFSF